MKTVGDAATDGLDRGTVAVAIGITLFGAAVLGTVAYAEATTTLRADYERFTADCDSLAGETRLEEDGIGMEPVVLNNTTVRACRNTTFGAYREARHRSMQTTPLNPSQWALYGGAGLSLVAGGIALGGRQWRHVS